MLLNLNVGLLGHVDSGKTSLAKALSQISSTAAFDKNPQSQERGITIDLGFSACQTDFPEHLKSTDNNEPSQYDQLQFTFIDCPGHASLIRTIIGGAQIMDIMILVIDIVKGIQTQTAECLIIGELTCHKMIVALNKIDLLDPDKEIVIINKFTKKIKSILAQTKTFQQSPIIPISVIKLQNLQELLNSLIDNSFIPLRNFQLPLLIAVDHCFTIKSQGTICTGTILQGTVNVNDDIEIPSLQQCRKIKSIQMFRKPLKKAVQGDRVGLCLAHFDSKSLERGLLAKPGYVHSVKSTIFKFNKIKYFKGKIASKSKFHFSIGHETVIGQITLFKQSTASVSAAAMTTDSKLFDWSHDYEYLSEIDEVNQSEENTLTLKTIFVLVEFEHFVIVPENALIIASKLDMDYTVNQCRIAFWSYILECYYGDTKSYLDTFMVKLKIFKEKIKIGTVQRVVSDTELIVDNLFKKESNRELFIGKKIQLSTGEIGIIDSTFGSTSKIRLRFNDVLPVDTMNTLKSPRNVNVILKYKKFLYDKSNKIRQ